MRTRPKLSLFAAAAALPLTLAACGAEPAGEDDLPEPEITSAPEDVSGDEISEAVPGVEEAYPEGDTPNTADLDSESDAEYTDVADPPE